MASNKRYLKQLIRGLGSGGPGRTGAVIGFLFALSLVIFGFGKTLFILLMTVIGYLLGVRYFTNRDDFKSLLDKLFPPGKFR